ncbi:MAG: hypothetical protein H0T72_11985 [Chloroflexia bacterium]|nr:hypothetical protein [Chloroflexia bacterium]
MPVSLAHVGQHLLAPRTLLRRRPVQIAIGVAAVATILAIVLAPETTPSTWDWVRILLIGLLGTGSVLMFVAAQPPAADAVERRARLLIAAALVTLALAINLTFTLGTALIFSIGFTVVVLIATENRDHRIPRLISGALIAGIPFWVWSALQAWTWGLLLLIPLAAIGVISDGHMRAAVASPEDADSLLTPRAHRLACWLGIFGSALIALVAGLLSDAANGVVALGAVGAIVLVGLEAGTPLSAAPGARTSLALAEAALLWVAICWIVSL